MPAIHRVPRSSSSAAGLLGAILAFVPAALAAQSVPWSTKSTDSEVPLPSATPDWDASLVHESDVGIWTVGTAKPFGMHGAPEVFGLDDKGRCTILSSYSGKWTPNQTVQDGKWLGVFAEVDLDAFRAGAEIYTGGQNGRLYQIVAGDDYIFDTRVIARLGAEELHTTVAGDLLPSRPGNELLVFTRSGQVWDVRPPEFAHGEWTRTLVAQLRGRVRQALLLPRARGAPDDPDDSRESDESHDASTPDESSAPGEVPWFATVSRAGQVALMRMTETGLDANVIVDEPMGFGRIALRPPRDGEPTVLYVTRDDGVVLRLEQGADAWTREIVYAGPQGPRGIAAGRFHADADVESFAVFGYSHKVQLVSRRPGEPWRVETLFVDRDKGHWLSAAELDGRNGTDELLASGYGGRIVLLARPPGYGLPGVIVDPDPTPREDAWDDADDGDCDDDDDRAGATSTASASGSTRAPAAQKSSGAASAPGARKTVDAARASGAPKTSDAQATSQADGMRFGVRARPGDAVLSPLDYGGGFETKSLVFETLVRRGSDGRLVPGLAEDWTLADDGARLTLNLRRDAVFHDGTAVDASAVVQHLRRWVGLPEHGWLRGGARVHSLDAPDAHTVVVQLSEPWDLLSELVAINPCAVAAPSSRDEQGRLVGAVGSGPFRVLDAPRDDPRVLVYERVADGRRVQLVRYTSDESMRAFDDLLAGDLDALVDGPADVVPRERVHEAEAAGLRVTSAPGTSVVWLDLRCEDGPLADVSTRRALRDAIDRERVAHAADLGHADPVATFGLPSAGWPSTAQDGASHAGDAAPRLAVRADDARGDPGRPDDTHAADAQLRPLQTAGPLRLVVDGTQSRAVRAGRELAAQLAAAGADVLLLTPAPTELDERLAAGAWDAVLRRTWGAPYDPDLTLRATFLSPPTVRSAARTVSLDAHPELAEIVERSAREPDERRRRALYAELQDVIDAQAPVIPLYAPQRLAVTRSELPPPPAGLDPYHLDAGWITSTMR